MVFLVAANVIVNVCIGAPFGLLLLLPMVLLALLLPGWHSGFCWCGFVVVVPVGVCNDGSVVGCCLVFFVGRVFVASGVIFDVF